MSPTVTGYDYIAIKGDGTPTIAGTTVKVVELVVAKMAYGWSPEELHFQHPDLTLGQIHVALAYYWDHAEELDTDIERRLRRADSIHSASEPSPLGKRLKAHRQQ